MTTSESTGGQSFLTPWKEGLRQLNIWAAEHSVFVAAVILFGLLESLRRFMPGRPTGATAWLFNAVMFSLEGITLAGGVLPLLCSTCCTICVAAIRERHRFRQERARLDRELSRGSDQMPSTTEISVTGQEHL